MSKNVSPVTWMLGLGVGAALLWHISGGQKRMNEDAFKRLIKQAGITNPKEIWRICCEDYHKNLHKELTKAKAELIEANARIAAGEEICRVGQGLADVRKMMRGEDLPKAIKSKQFWGLEVSKEEMDEALAGIRKNEVPIEVKTAIIAHWWTQLWQLFVPWGILTPKEIEEIEEPFFRLASEENREAILRSEVFTYKKLYEISKASLDKELERKKGDRQSHYDALQSLRKEFDEEREAWRKEKEALQKEIAQCKEEASHV